LEIAMTPADADQAKPTDAKQELEMMREKLRRLLSDARPLLDHLDEAVGEARAASVTARNRLEAEVRERPLTALLVAAGIGYLIASLRRR
jgi:ElaB/YqjD/DUF883 family membrane-anchored ribosome-binding protein